MCIRDEQLENNFIRHDLLFLKNIFSSQLTRKLISVEMFRVFLLAVSYICSATYLTSPLGQRLCCIVLFIKLFIISMYK